MTHPPTLAVLAHRARGNPQYPRPIAMQDILDEAGLSVQWWHQLARGVIREPADDKLDRLCAALGVSRAVLDRARRETLRRLDEGQPV